MKGSEKKSALLCLPGFMLLLLTEAWTVQPGTHAWIRSVLGCLILICFLLSAKVRRNSAISMLWSIAGVMLGFSVFSADAEDLIGFAAVFGVLTGPVWGIGLLGTLIRRSSSTVLKRVNGMIFRLSWILFLPFMGRMEGVSGGVILLWAAESFLWSRALEAEGAEKRDNLWKNWMFLLGCIWIYACLLSGCDYEMFWMNDRIFNPCLFCILPFLLHEWRTFLLKKYPEKRRRAASLYYLTAFAGFLFLMGITCRFNAYASWRPDAGAYVILMACTVFAAARGQIQTEGKSERGFEWGLSLIYACMAGLCVLAGNARLEWIRTEAEGLGLPGVISGLLKEGAYRKALLYSFISDGGPAAAGLILLLFFMAGQIFLILRIRCTSIHKVQRKRIYVWSIIFRSLLAVCMLACGVENHTYLLPFGPGNGMDLVVLYVLGCDLYGDEGKSNVKRSGIYTGKVG